MSISSQIIIGRLDVSQDSLTLGIKITKMKGWLPLDTIVQEGMTILKLLAGKYEMLLIRWDAKGKISLSPTENDWQHVAYPSLSWIFALTL